MFSATQKFLATKTEFPVVIVEKGTGTLPVSFADADLNTLLAAAQEDLKTRQEASAKVAEAKAERELKKLAKAEKVEVPALEPVGATEPETTVSIVNALIAEATDSTPRTKKGKKA